MSGLKNDQSNKKEFPVIILAAVLLVIAAAVSAGIIYAKNSENGSEQSIFSDPSGVPDKVAYIKSDTYTTPYGTFEPIEHILEINEYMTLNPVILDAESSIGYITESGDVQTAHSVMEKVKSLADEICGNIDSDHDKAQALAMWVGTNVAYDFDAAESNLYALSVISLEAILNNDLRTTCAGFANLFSAMCYTQDIYCLNMKGGTASEGWTRRELEKAPANHEWNAVAADGEWYYIDCTWITDRSYSGGVYFGGEMTEPFYAIFGFGEMSIEHRIDRCEFRNFSVDK